MSHCLVLNLSSFDLVGQCLSKWRSLNFLYEVKTSGTLVRKDLNDDEWLRALLELPAALFVKTGVAFHRFDTRQPICS